MAWLWPLPGPGKVRVYPKEPAAPRLAGGASGSAPGRARLSGRLPRLRPSGYLWGPSLTRSGTKAGAAWSQASSSSHSFLTKGVAPWCSAVPVWPACAVKAPLCRGSLEAQLSEAPSRVPARQGGLGLGPSAGACRTQPSLLCPAPHVVLRPSAPRELRPACPGPLGLQPRPLFFVLKPFFRIKLSHNPKHF